MSYGKNLSTCIGEALSMRVRVHFFLLYNITYILYHECVLCFFFFSCPSSFFFCVIPRVHARGGNDLRIFLVWWCRWMQFLFFDVWAVSYPLPMSVHRTVYWKQCTKRDSCYHPSHLFSRCCLTLNTWYPPSRKLFGALLMANESHWDKQFFFFFRFFFRCVLRRFRVPDPEGKNKERQS